MVGVVEGVLDWLVVLDSGEVDAAPLEENREANVSWAWPPQQACGQRGVWRELRLTTIMGVRKLKLRKAKALS